MDEDEPTLGNIAKEFITPVYVERARERARSAKTVWDLVFLPIGFGAIGGFWYAFAKLFLWTHVLIFPADIPRMQALLSGPMTLAQA
jgi:hypothetical protein